MSCIEDLCAGCEWKTCKHWAITCALRNQDVWYVHTRTQMHMCECALTCTGIVENIACATINSPYGGEMVHFLLFPLYSFTDNICLPWFFPGASNYLSSVFTYCYNPMYFEIHLCQNTQPISALRSQLGSLLIVSAYHTQFPSSEQMSEITQSHRRVWNVWFHKCHTM
jgi:hypothetical protein